MKMKAILTAAAILTGSMASAACVGIVPAGSGHVFWKDVIKGAETAGSNLGIDVYARGPNDESNAAGQLRVIETALKKGCVGMVIAPGSQEVVARVAELQAQGIPTVYVDRDMGGDRHTVVMTDNFEAGRQAAKHLSDTLGGSGQVAVLRMQKGVASTTARENGFIEGAAEHGLEVVFEGYIGSNVGKARRVVRSFLEAETVDGVFTPNESTTMAVVLEVEALGGSMMFHHVGFDYTPDFAEAIGDQRLAGVMVQRPFEFGYQGVQMLAQVLNGEAPNEMTFIETVFVNSENIDTAGVNDVIQSGS